MMGQRFLAIASRNNVIAGAWRDRARSLCEIHSLTTYHDSKRLLVCGSGIASRTLPRASGVVVGDLYRADQVIGAGSMSEAHAARLLASRGQHLIDQHWGNYIAFLADELAPLDVVRAPIGDLPCLFTVLPDAVVFASDVEMLVKLGAAEVKANRVRLARFLLAEDLHRDETCLDAINELPGGYRLSVGKAEIDITPRWTPWSFVEPALAITNVAEAADAVRASVLQSVGAITAPHDRIVLRLSGGLDSSIVAAALKAYGRDVHALNLVTADPSGDERDYARMVASHLGYGLAEQTRELGHVDITRSEAGALPRPTARAFAQASTRRSRILADETGANAIVDGGGGDSIFCSLASARLAADCLMTGRGKGHFWSTTRNVAALAQVSSFAVGRRAWSIRLRSSPEIAHPIDARFLSAEVASEMATARSHPWLEAPRQTLPGRAAHVAALATVQGVREGADPTRSLPIHSPLLTQPVVETCLRIPSWLWVHQGRDRAVARRAFAELLPAGIIQRRSKGSPDSFLIELYDANRSLIRAMLLDGALAATGVLDLQTIAAALDDQRPVMGVDFYRILRLVDIDAWLRSL